LSGIIPQIEAAPNVNKTCSRWDNSERGDREKLGWPGARIAWIKNVPRNASSGVPQLTLQVRERLRLLQTLQTSVVDLVRGFRESVTYSRPTPLSMAAKERRYPIPQGKAQPNGALRHGMVGSGPGCSGAQSTDADPHVSWKSIRSDHLPRSSGAIPHWKLAFPQNAAHGNAQSRVGGASRPPSKKAPPVSEPLARYAQDKRADVSIRMHLAGSHASAKSHKQRMATVATEIPRFNCHVAPPREEPNERSETAKTPNNKQEAPIACDKEKE